MLNRILQMGDTFKLEQISYRALQRRFGRSVGMRAPGMFVERLCRKAESAGGEVIEFEPEIIEAGVRPNVMLTEQPVLGGEVDP